MRKTRDDAWCQVFYISIKYVRLSMVIIDETITQSKCVKIKNVNLPSFLTTQCNDKQSWHYNN